jgi:hypothetical protein
MGTNKKHLRNLFLSVQFPKYGIDPLTLAYISLGKKSRALRE